ncbi:MAG TPA: FtsX-like permease family protein [Candidatus Limnocylindrales bacterium]|nr:FtsX-like permease family protein [Candidatus Limnocylindrales bacterium]
MRLASIAWRGLLARPLRTALATAGVALGVAVVAATLTAGASSEAALRSASADLLGHADVRLRAFDDAGFRPRTVQAVRALDGVAAAAPVSERRLTVSTAPGDDEQVFTLHVYGIDPEVDPLVRPGNVVAGRPLSIDGAADALVPAGWAADHRLGIGDRLLLGGRRLGQPPLEIVGIVADRGLAATEGGDVLIVARDTLDAAFESPAPIRYLDVDLGDDSPAALARVTAALTEPYVVETPADAARRLAGAQAGFVGVAFLFGLVALVVGAFLVTNTLAMMLGERVRELGLLRAAGTTSRQVLGIVLRQALAIGVVGSAVGIGLGIVLARLMIGMLSSTRAILVEGMALPLGGLVVAFGLGLLVTLVGALVPALRAARLAPLDALRPSRRPDRGLLDRARPILYAELGIVALGIGILVATGADAPLLPVVLGLGLLVGGALAAAFVLEPMGRVVGRPFEWFFGAQGTLGRVNLSRDRARTGLTVGAMMIALAAVVTLGTVAESARAGTERWVGSILPGGHAIRTGVPLEADAFRPGFEATPGVHTVSPVLELPVVRVMDDGFEEAVVAGIDPNVFQDEGALIVTGSRRADAFGALRAGGAVLVPAPLADRAAIAIGDTLSLARPGVAATEFRVAGIVEYTLPARTADGALLVSSADARDRFGATDASLWIMVPRPDVPPSVFAAAVRDTAQQLAAEAIGPRELAGELARSLDALGGLFDVLALVAVAIAALGIVNTLGVGISERVREIAILRSHGMTVGQVQAMVVAEAAIMGAIAGVLAVVIGLAVAAAFVSGGASGELAAGLRLPWPLLVAVILLGMGVAALAGLYPARVAASLPIVRSLKHFE